MAQYKYSCNGNAHPLGFLFASKEAIPSFCPTCRIAWLLRQKKQPSVVNYLFRRSTGSSPSSLAPSSECNLWEAILTGRFIAGRKNVSSWHAQDGMRALQYFQSNTDQLRFIPLSKPEACSQHLDYLRHINRKIAFANDTIQFMSEWWTNYLMTHLCTNFPPDTAVSDFKLRLLHGPPMNPFLMKEPGRYSTVPREESTAGDPNNIVTSVFCPRNRSRSFSFSAEDGPDSRW